MFDFFFSCGFGGCGGGDGGLVTGGSMVFDFFFLVGLVAMVVV